MKKYARKLLLVVAASIGCFGVSAQELPGLVSWWQGEDNVLDSKGANNGSIYVAPPPIMPVAYVAGKAGQAFKFNGGRVIVPSSASLMPANLTVQVWVKGTGISAFQYILCKGGGAGSIQYAIYTGDTGTAKFFVYAGGYVVSPAAPATVWDGNWHQLTGVWDGAGATLYMDGAAVGTTPGPGSIDYSAPQPLVIGAFDTAGAYPYPGSLDEMKVFNRAMPANEVLDTYNDPNAAAGTTGLVSWYKAEGNAEDAQGVNNGDDGNGTPPPPRIFAYGDGKNGTAFFAKNGIATVPDAPELRPENLTVQAWVKSVAPGPFRYLICKSRTANGVSYALYTEDGGGLNFFVTLAGGGSVKSPVIGSEKLWDGAWHLATGTFDGSTVRLYVDGIEVESGSPAAGAIEYAGSAELIFGDYRIEGGLPFWGLLDDVQLYSRALAPTEIFQYYTENKLVAWWSASMNADDAIGGNNGTLVGTTKYGAGRGAWGAFANGAAGSVQIPDAASLRPNTVTVEAVVKSTAPGANKYIISKSNSDTDASYAVFTGPSGGVAFYVTTPSGRVVSPAADASIWDGLFHAVAGVYDGLTARLYVDGKEVGSGTASTGNIVYGSYQSGKLIFGDFSETPGSAVFTGIIDQVKIYNTALTAQAVASDTFQPILIANQPQDTMVNPGSTATLSVTARGEAPVSYQWMKDGVDLLGETNAKLLRTDAQTGAYSVRVSPGTVTYTAGKYGQAYNSAALGIARFPNDPAFSPTNTPFTVQLWAKAAPVGNFKYLLSKSRSSGAYNSSYGLYSADTGGLVWFIVLDGTALGFVTARTDSSVWDDAWHQITGTWDGNSLGLYIDGNVAQMTDSFGGGDIAFATNYLNGDIQLGDVSATPGTFHFPGLLDEVKFFDRALTGTEVAETYSNPNGSAGTTGLVGFWKLDNNLNDETHQHDGFAIPAPGVLVSRTATLSAQALPPSISGASLSGTDFQATVTGSAGSSYVVLRAPDFTNWTPIKTNTAPFTFSDPLSAGGKFYRVRSE